MIAEHGPDAVVAALTPILTDDRRQRIEDVLSARLSSLTVILENLYDPHNGAAAIRSVEALGLTSVQVIEAATPFSAASGVTIGAQKWIDVHKHVSVRDCVQAVRDRGMSLCATVPGAGRTVADLDPSIPQAVAFGNEHDGLTGELIAACDESVSIPMFGFTRSFNLSVSVALMMSELAARRRGHLGGGDLDESTRARLRARWYFLGVRGAGEIVAKHVSK